MSRRSVAGPEPQRDPTGRPGPAKGSGGMRLVSDDDATVIC
jgi:hypothetical protein